MDPGPNDSRLWFGRHHVARRGWAAGRSYNSVGDSHPVPVLNRVALAEGACADRGTEDGSRLARFWRACGAYGRRMGFVCQASRAARRIAAGIRDWREGRPPCTHTFCSFSLADRTRTPGVREGDRGDGASMASLSCWLGIPDGRRTDGLRFRRAFLDLAEGCREGRSGHGKPLYFDGLGSRDCGCAEDTVAVDRVLHFMGDRICRVGSEPKHCSEAAHKVGLNLEKSSGLGSNLTNQDGIADVSLEVSGKSETNSIRYSLYGIRGGCLPEVLRCVQIG